MIGIGIGIPVSSLSAGGGYVDIVREGVLAGFVTFTRASSGTYYDSAGVLQTALTDIPRIDYDPSTLALRGLLIEEERTNLLTYSEQFDDAAWINGGVTVSANTTTAPAGVVTGDTVEVSVAGGSKSIREDKTVSALQYTFSVFVRAGTDSVLDIGIYQGGFVAQSAKIISGPGTLGGGAGLQTISSLSSSEWTRIAVTSTAALSAAAASFYCYPGGAINSVGDSVILWGAQLEVGAFATSYIPTVGSAVTRAADSGICADLSLLGYDQTKGTIYIEGVGPAGQTCDWAQLNNSTINEGVFLYSSAGTNAASDYRDGGVTQASVSGAIDIAVPWKFATAFAANDFAACANGGAVSTDVSGTLGTPTRLVIGAACSAYASGLKVVTIKNLRYYPRRLTNAELQALTA